MKDENKPPEEAARKAKMQPSKTSAKKKQKLVMFIGQTRYPIVKHVAKKVLGMRTTLNEEEEWDVCWTDVSVQAERLYRMKPYQRINHFPGMFSLARKNHLARNLTRLQKTFPNDYNFFPKTWLLPAEFSDFIRQFNVPTTKGNSKQKKNPVFIAKPEASCQGRGIFLSRSLDNFDP